MDVIHVLFHPLGRVTSGKELRVMCNVVKSFNYEIKIIVSSDIIGENIITLNYTSLWNHS